MHVQHLALLSVTGSFLFTAPGLHAALPGSRVLAHGDFAVELMDPGAPDRYNRGVRFTPVAAIIGAARGGEEFLYQESGHDPLTDVAGLFSEFDLGTSPPGFAEAKIGEGFVKVGVGVLKKGAANYQFYPQHEIIRLATTEAAWGSETARFHQVCEPDNGYGYDLAATVTVGAGMIVVDWRLENTGTKPFETEQYAHNCFRFNRQSIGPGYEVRFPHDFQARGLQKDQRQVGRTIEFTEKIPAAVNIEADYPPDYTGPNSVEVIHPASGLFVNCLTSVRSLRTAVHAAEKYVCPEQFIAIRLQPGEHATWQRRYEFGK